MKQIEEENIKREKERLKKEEEEEQKRKEYEEQMKKQIEERLKKDEEERMKKIIFKSNTTNLFMILKRLFNSINIKQYYFDLFYNNLQKIILSNFNNLIDYEITDKEYFNFIQNKTKYYLLKKYYDSFINNLKYLKQKKLIYNNFKIKGQKYLLYRNYKKKAYIFEALNKFAKKQKKWIITTQNELLKGLIWNCIDSLKLYVNYRKIKKYFQIKKTKKIFDALKNNKLLSFDMAKKSKKLSLIFEYKLFFKTIKKDILIKKGLEVNNKISDEFRKQNLMKKIFKLIESYYRHKQEKDLKNKQKFIAKHENKDFINIKVTQKQTVGYKNNRAMKKVINKINIA